MSIDLIQVRPRIILISGPSAAGKTTLCRYLVENFGDEYEHVRQDDYLNDPNTYPMFGEFRVWEDPSNIMFDTLIAHILTLKAGEPVQWRTFAKHEGEAVHRYNIQPKPFILIDGSLLLTNAEVMRLGDKKIYLDVPLEISLARRKERSKIWNLDLDRYDLEVVVPSYAKYRFQRDHADHVVNGTLKTEEIANEIRRILIEGW